MLLRPYAILFLLGLLISIAAAFWFPELQKLYIKDNRVVENTGALLYALAALLSLVAAWYWRSKRFVPIAFALVGIVCALDEISWGREELRFEPVKILGVKIDAVHDLNDVAVRAVSEYGETAEFWLVTILAVALSSWSVFISRDWLRTAFAYERGYFFILMAIFFVLSSAHDLIHLDISKVAKLRLSVFEEYLELMAALALSFIAFSLLREGKQSLASENNTTNAH